VCLKEAGGDYDGEDDGDDEEEAVVPPHLHAQPPEHPLQPPVNHADPGKHAALLLCPTRVCATHNNNIQKLQQ
jgi:hypothetical protein